MRKKNLIPLTRQQAAIVGAYTGILAGPFLDLHKYAGEILNDPGITTIGMAVMVQKIKELSKQDFDDICATDETE